MFGYEIGGSGKRPRFRTVKTALTTLVTASKVSFPLLPLPLGGLLLADLVFVRFYPVSRVPHLRICSSRHLLLASQ